MKAVIVRRQKLSGHSRVCLLGSNSLPVVMAPPLVSVMAFKFNQLIIQPEYQPGGHPLRDEVSPFPSPATWQASESPIAPMAIARYPVDGTAAV
jgi:hypothetical protein